MRGNTLLHEEEIFRGGNFMLRENLKELTKGNYNGRNYQLFYELLEEIKQLLEQNQKNRKKDIECFYKLVEVIEKENIIFIKVDQNQILNSNNRGNLLHVLSLMYGEDFYTSNFFSLAFSNCYNLQIPGKFSFIKKPTSIEEVNKMFDSLKEILDSKKINETYILVNRIVNNLSLFLEKSTNMIFLTDQKLKDAYNAIVNILMSFDKKEAIIIDNLKNICDTINSQITFLDEEDEEINAIKLGDFLANFVKEYNNSLIPNTYEEKLACYYDKITETKFQELNNQNLPSYNDPDFIRYMNDLENMLQEKYSDQKQFAKKFAIVSMHHCGYYRR